MIARRLPALAAAVAAFMAVAVPVPAQQCQSAPLCRETAPGGALLHDPNSSGSRVWTTACGPNTTRPRLDRICEQISTCSDAGGFGRFLRAVTFHCRAKQFEGYFGLDGMTFGILDWTSDNLPAVMRAYRQRSQAGFDELVGRAGLSVKDGCLDVQDVCTRNKQGRLMCDAGFRDAFSAALGTADFQKAQADQALTQYNRRIDRFAHLGLKTEYGNTAMAVVANNLLASEACRPETWKRLCAAHGDEKSLVDCMLDQYVDNSCRGSRRGSMERAKVIKEVFAGATPSENIHPTADAVIACSDRWGRARD